MKIIATTEFGFMIEASKDEIGQLTGYHSIYDRERKERPLRIGDVINVSGMFNYLYDLGDARAKLKRVSTELRELAQKVDVVAPIIPEKKEVK